MEKIIMKILIVLMASLVFTSFTYAAGYMKLGDIKGEVHKSNMNKDVAENKKAQPGAKESSMHQGAMNSVRPQKPGSTRLDKSSTKVWTNGSASSVKKPESKK
tara:strand:+ start:37 stop:345 length:309 start_codon:yes stop_codon:yes gene_type:complete